MTLKNVRAIPGGTALAPMLAVDETDDVGLPRLVGWGQLQVAAGVPSWVTQSGYFTNVIDDNGVGDFNLHQVVADANVMVFGPENGRGEWAAQEGPFVGGQANVKTYTWRGATVAVDPGTHNGTITSDPVAVDIAGNMYIFAVKLL